MLLLSAVACESPEGKNLLNMYTLSMVWNITEHVLLA